MSIFADFSNFLETRLEDFLRNNPHLELQVLLEELLEQEQDTLKLIAQLQVEEKHLQEQILLVAQDIQTWHSRITKAKEAGRLDLANAAQEREEALFRQGNQLWEQRQSIEKRLIQAKELLQQIQQRKKEVQVKTDNQNTENRDTIGWNQGNNNSSKSNSYDPLEEKFQNWEIEDEISKMKRKLGIVDSE